MSAAPCYSNNSTGRRSNLCPSATSSRTGSLSDPTSTLTSRSIGIITASPSHWWGNNPARAPRHPVRPNIDYHVEIDRHYYSVPFQLVGQQLDARYTAMTVEIFHRG